MICAGNKRSLFASRNGKCVLPILRVIRVELRVELARECGAETSPVAKGVARVRNERSHQGIFERPRCARAAIVYRGPRRGFLPARVGVPDAREELPEDRRG